MARLARRINRLPGDSQRRIADDPRVIAVAPHHAYEFSAGIEERAGRRFEGVIPQFFEIVVDADDITRRVALSARRIRRRRRTSIGECCLERIAIVLLGRNLHRAQTRSQIERRRRGGAFWHGGGRLRFRNDRPRLRRHQALGTLRRHRLLCLREHFDCWI